VSAARCQDAPMRRPSRTVLLVGLLAALPVIVSTIRAAAVGWVPVGDDAIIAARAYDVFSTRPPLLGQYSAATGGGESVYSLGPLLYWLLAIPARIGPAAVLFTAGLVNVLSLMGVVALARRRGGDALMLVTAAAAAAMCWSFVPDSLHDIWNPSIALMPFALLMFVAWSVACGEHRLLPLLAVLASFAVQCHLTFVLPTIALVAVAGAGLTVAVRRDGAPADLRRWAAIAAVLTLVCWSAPLAEQVIHRPGNMVQVVRVGLDDRGKLGAAAGAHTVARTVGVPPVWLQEPRSPVGVLAAVQNAPAALTSATAVILLALLALIAAVAARRRRWPVAAAALIGLVVPLLLGVVAASTPTKDGLFISVGYTLRWGSVAGMFAWVACLWGAATLLRPGWERLALPGRRASWAGTAAVGAVAIAVSAGTRADRFEVRYEPANTIERAIEGANHDGAVMVEAPLRYFDLQAGAVYALRRSGEVRMPLFDRQLGRRYRPRDADRGPVIRITPEPARPGPGERVVAHVPYDSVDEKPSRARPPMLQVTVRPRR